MTVLALLLWHCETRRSTCIALCNYGYRNVYELADTLDLRQSKLEFEPRKP